MATIDLGEGNRFIITKTHEEITTLLEQLRELEEKYPVFEIKEIKLPESKEKDQLLDIEKTTSEPKKTKKRIKIRRRQKDQPEKTFSDDGPEFIELDTSQEQDMLEIDKEQPQQDIYENLTEWTEVQSEKMIQPGQTTKTPDLEPEIPTQEIKSETPEIKKHRVKIISGTSIKLIIDEEGNLVLADKPKTVIKKKVKTGGKKEEKTIKSRLRRIVPHRKKKEETKNNS